MASTDMEESLRLSDGICLPHLKLALESIQDGEKYEKLLVIHLEKLEVLQGELSELIRKNDYRFTSEGFGKEMSSWLRALAMVAGNDSMRQGAKDFSLPSSP